MAVITPPSFQERRDNDHRPRGSGSSADPRRQDLLTTDTHAQSESQATRHLTRRNLASIPTELCNSNSPKPHDLIQTFQQLNTTLPPFFAIKMATDASLAGTSPMERFMLDIPGTVERLSCCEDTRRNVDE